MRRAKAQTPMEEGAAPRLSHNLVGQRLGRKGRDTRDRILAATAELLAEGPETAISLSEIARRASLGMTSLYLYFADLTELLLAVLEPIMASAEDAYVNHLRQSWADEDLQGHCVAFVRKYHSFWQQHARILHLRNSMADAADIRMLEHRLQSAVPLIALITRQMDRDPTDRSSPAYAMATTLFIGLDRLVAVRTDGGMALRMTNSENQILPNRLLAEARLMELGIRDARTGSNFDRLFPTDR